MSTQVAVTANHHYAPAALGGMPWVMPAREDAAAVAPSGPVLHFAPDSEIYAEGNEARSYYKVVSGVVRTCKFMSDGRRQIDAFHAAGDVFGFEAGAEHRHSAEAVSDCTVIPYRRRGTETMIAADDRLARQMFSHAMRCLERAQEHSLLLGRRSAAEKLAAFLLEMAGRKPGSATIDLVMTRQDIADYLGLTIETVSRTLSQFERDEVIALPAARRVVIKNRAALQQLNS